MGYTMEGTIEINLADFFGWVTDHYTPEPSDEMALGVPRVNKSNGTIEIDFAASSDGNPADWAVLPKAVRQWDDLK